jgi:integrase
MARREYGSDSLYQRKSDWRWVGAVENGTYPNGTRRRAVVTAKGCAGGCKARCPHIVEIKRRLKLKQRDLARGEQSSSRTTVKAWADTYLGMRVHDLAPKGYNAAANPIKNWVVPTIGHRRLDQLTPADVRAVHDACRAAGRQSADVHRALHTMLNAAIAEGHTVASRVLAVKAPAPEKSDRTAMTVPEGIACLEVASTLPHGTRWAFTLLSGARLGECLGLTWNVVDLDAGEAIIEWQLQALPYNTPRDRSSGFRVPDGHEARHLVDAFHLVRPKSRKGYRVAPLLPAIVDGLRAWKQIAPPNPWGLVWPNLKGRPANDKHDRAEWWALQETAGVHHPSRLREDASTGELVPAPYHIHECRNFAATMLLEAGTAEHVVADLLGHTVVATSLRYRTVRREPLREAMEQAFAPLALP